MSDVLRNVPHYPTCVRMVKSMLLNPGNGVSNTDFKQLQECCISCFLVDHWKEWLAKEALEGMGDFTLTTRDTKTLKYTYDLALLAK